MLLILSFSAYAVQEQKSIGDRVKQNVMQSQQQTQQQMGPLTEEQQEALDDAITCERKIARYTEKVNKYKDKTNLDDFQKWKFNYYKKRLKWWKKYCAE